MNETTTAAITVQTEFPLEYQEQNDEDVAKALSDAINKAPKFSRRELNSQLSYWRRMEYKQRRSAFRTALKKRSAPLPNHQRTKHYKQQTAMAIAKGIVATDVVA